MEELPTNYLPAEKDSGIEIRRQNESLTSAPLLRELLDAMPYWVLIFNARRQIVHANRAACESLRFGLSDLLGLRFGEAIGCAHKAEASGCGTSEFCIMCGATAQIVSALWGQASSRECRIQAADPGKALDFKVWTTPLDHQGERYALLSAIDTGHEKRRRALERIFFHDVLGLLGAVRGLAELLPKADPSDSAGYCGDIILSVEQLVDGIVSQRELSAAESGELTVNLMAVPICRLLESLAGAYRAHAAAQGKTIVVHPGTIQDAVVTDKALLTRVLGNMIVNALEAEAPGATIVAGGGREEDGSSVLWVRNPTAMSREVRLQIFQRSFSTKGPSRGLGTYSMRLLTERYLRGTVSFASAEGSGTEFRVRLPDALRVPAIDSKLT